MRGGELGLLGMELLCGLYARYIGLWCIGFAAFISCSESLGEKRSESSSSFIQPESVAAELHEGYWLTFFPIGNALVIGRQESSKMRIAS